MKEELMEHVFNTMDKSSFRRVLLEDKQDLRMGEMLTVYFSAPIMFITLWFELHYGTNPPLGTLMI
jgi:hypothetical protein